MLRNTVKGWLRLDLVYQRITKAEEVLISA